VVAEDAAKALAAGPDSLPAALDAAGPSVELTPALTGDADEQVVVIPLLHGPLGEDGTVQGLLELLGVPYVGSGVLSSAVSMDKVVAKELLQANGLRVATWQAVSDHERTASTASEVAAALGLPVFVKPANMGSSIGVSRADSLEELDAALGTALVYDDVAIVEQMVRGREIEVAVLGNDEPRASVPGEIVLSHVFYSYEDKYVLNGAQLSAAARRRAVRQRGGRRRSGLRAAAWQSTSSSTSRAGSRQRSTPSGLPPISMYPAVQATGVS
jgi:D-alanine-D-alanine ligase